MRSSVRSHFGSSMLKPLPFSTMPNKAGKAGRAGTVVVKKPSTADIQNGVGDFKQAYSCCVGSTSACLPYVDAGGRRSDLILACSSWVCASRDFTADTWKSFTSPTMRAGFLAIHADKSAAKAAAMTAHPKGFDHLVECKWDVTDATAQDWAKKIAKRLMHLMRHVKQASGIQPQPKWLTTTLLGPTACKLELREIAAPLPAAPAAAAAAAAAATTDKDEDGQDADEEAEEEEKVDDEAIDTPSTSTSVGNKFLASDGWISEYCWETGNGRRYRPEKPAKKDYATSHKIRSHLGGDGPVLCQFSDGTFAELEVTQAEKWPEQFKTSGPSMSAALPSRTMGVKK